MSPPPIRSLFRQEAIDAQREKLLGEVSKARPVPVWVFTVLAATLAGALLTFAFVGHYTRPAVNAWTATWNSILAQRG
ncbi:hypothetical protein SBBP2_20170 [Burkholderiales bacterium]|nr:hypothetical protein SBBP2_20170 [Burkholderiales bacterium]